MIMRQVRVVDKSDSIIGNRVRIGAEASANPLLNVLNYALLILARTQIGGWHEVISEELRIVDLR